MTFQKGRSGNPNGRPRGSRSRVAALLDRLAEADAAEVYEAVKGLALGGDMQAARLILDRAWPVPKGRRIDLDLPELYTADDARAAVGAIVGAALQGRLAPGEARDLFSLVAAWAAAGAPSAEPGDGGLDPLGLPALTDQELDTLEFLLRKTHDAGRAARGLDGDGGDEAGGGTGSGVY